MNFYSKYLFPKAVQFACSRQAHMQQRQKMVPLAQGIVLEVGIGSGLNFSFYNADRVQKVIGLDPSPDLIRLAKQAANAVSFDVEFMELPCEELPLADNSVDTVLMTYTLCSIADTKRALREMARVLKPSGLLIFCEHGAARDLAIRRYQNYLNPFWGRIAEGCQLNRAIPELIEQGGFKLNEVQAEYISGLRLLSFNYWGTAKLAR
jgi:ubiquinone/menaquinone biosynthesis C-methylase UbiE